MNKTFEDYLEESSLSRVYKHYKEHDTGTISAFRYAKECGEGDAYSLPENKERNALLKAKLLKLGYGVVPIKGVYIENYNSDNAKEVAEESFLVVDIQDKGDLERSLKRLGSEFEQDSVTFSKSSGEYFIIGTSKTCPNAYPSYGERIVLGSPLFGSDGVFHSKVKGRPFVFKSAVKTDIETLDKHTPTEIRSIDKLSEKSVAIGSFEKFIGEETSTADVASVPSAIGAVEKRVYPSVETDCKKPKKKKQRHHHAHW